MTVESPATEGLQAGLTAAGGHLGLRDNQALDLLKARWWVMAAMYLAVVLTIIIAFGSQLARFFG